MSLFTQYNDILFGPTTSRFIRPEGRIVADNDGTLREIYLSVVVGYDIVHGNAWVIRKRDRVCLGPSMDPLAKWLGLNKSILWDYLQQSIEIGKKPYWRVYYTREHQKEPINLKQDFS